ncbi:MAG: hypothetical protein WBN55_07790 [Eudoraea sp.]|uniref:FKBP-type peptidyl-prolyl cis-trans isomerase n=1 Tax=Eudoraea sp. TaxID=1979955 RepID=UPI003C77E0BF
MKEKGVLLFIAVLAIISSCSNDDSSDVIIVPPRPLAEVEAENDAEIREYLQTHYYNYEEFANPPADFNYKIVLDTISGSAIDKIPLIDQVSTMTIPVSSETFNLDEDVTVDHTLYYLAAREGIGESPTVGDSTFVAYEGQLLSGDVFDSNITYTWQYLPFFLRGYAAGVSQFKVGGEVISNIDGTVDITGSGIGLMFIPSGLAYFDNPPLGSGIFNYDILVFQVNTGLFIESTDYDNDGIPSIMEDLNNNGNLSDDNSDESVELSSGFGFIPDHLDIDDDQDGILTRDEIVIDNEGNISFPDSDGDGTPDYRDPDS